MDLSMVDFAWINSLPGILAAIFLLMFAAILTACTPRYSKPEQVSPTPAAVTTQLVKQLSRADIQKRLQKLADQPAPTNLKLGAMCYKVAGPAERAEYVCPKCAEKSLYTKGLAYVLESDIQDSRRQIRTLQTLVDRSITLDESEFCRKCSPEIKDPRLILKINFDDGKSNIVTKVTPNDLLLLNEFFLGKRVHDAGQDAETPLKDCLPRLRELLGEKPK